MKKFVFMLLCSVCLGTLTVNAQADKIIGTYYAVQDGAKSKIKFTKIGKDTYRGQVVWVEKTKNADGSLKTDVKNPVEAKRKTPVDQIVIVESVKYDADDKEWEDGRIYDPTSGKSYKVEITFKDAKTLQVKGMLGPFSKKVYWTKLD